jgi:hypothetical protein
MGSTLFFMRPRKAKGYYDMPRNYYYIQNMPIVASYIKSECPFEFETILLFAVENLE